MRSTCATPRPHVDTFVIISGDSDFSPLVSKLRENNKGVIGVGVKNSTSDLLIANCDEFIYYDDLVREQPKTTARRAQESAPGEPAAAAQPAHAAATARQSPRKRTRSRRPSIWCWRPSSAARRARRRGQDLGLDGQAGVEAPAPGIQRELLRLPLIQQAAGRGRAARRLLALERDDKSGGYLVHSTADTADMRRANKLPQRGSQNEGWRRRTVKQQMLSTGERQAAHADSVATRNPAANGRQPIATCR